MPPPGVRLTVDPLTQLANRRRFLAFLEQEWHFGIRERTSLALLMLDVDFFERFNDAHGGPAGDDCLRRVAAVLTGRVKRTSDLVARYGGEEFAVILAGAEEAGALSVAHWIRGAVERQAIPHGASSVSDYVTVSIGVAAVAPVDGGSPERLIAAADAALLRAKELGRNAVTTGAGTGAHFPAGV
jgi:two-component system cell cycle response regulator